jgi:DNA-binding transcriptional LysR family regulator
VSTSLWEARSGPQLAALADGRLDLALVFAGPLAAQLRSRQVLTIPLVAVVSRRHPWASLRQVPFRELASQPCVLFHRDQSPAMHDALVTAARQCGIALAVSEEVDDSGATGIVIATRQVVGFASAERAIHPPGSELVSVRLVDPVPTVGLSAVWRPDPQPVVGAFLDCLELAGPFTAAGPPPYSEPTRETPLPAGSAGHG